MMVKQKKREIEIFMYDINKQLKNDQLPVDLIEKTM